MTTTTINPKPLNVNLPSGLPRGVQSAIAGLLGVSRQAVSAAIKEPERYSQIAKFVSRYQQTGKLPKRRAQVAA